MPKVYFCENFPKIGPTVSKILYARAAKWNHLLSGTCFRACIVSSSRLILVLFVFGSAAQVSPISKLSWIWTRTRTSLDGFHVEANCFSAAIAPQKLKFRLIFFCYVFIQRIWFFAKVVKFLFLKLFKRDATKRTYIHILVIFIDLCRTRHKPNT